MNRQRVARELVRLARELTAAKSYTVKKDFRTKKGTEYRKGDRVTVDEYVNKYPYLVRFSTDDGRKVALPASAAHKFIQGFPKPPSERTMMNWMSRGVAISLDGKRVEPDGYSPAHAPSWMLVMGVI